MLGPQYGHPYCYSCAAAAMAGGPRRRQQRLGGGPRRALTVGHTGAGGGRGGASRGGAVGGAVQALAAAAAVAPSPITRPWNLPGGRHGALADGLLGTILPPSPLLPFSRPPVGGDGDDGRGAADGDGAVKKAGFRTRRPLEEHLASADGVAAAGAWPPLAAAAAPLRSLSASPIPPPLGHHVYDGPGPAAGGAGRQTPVCYI